MLVCLVLAESHSLDRQIKTYQQETNSVASCMSSNAAHAALLSATNSKVQSFVETLAGW
jgi:hypothetical protein